MRKVEAHILTLEEKYKSDPILLAFLKKKLQIRGWAGKLDDVEREYLDRAKPEWWVKAKELGKKYGRFAKT